jgi:hypothetical protein
MRYIYSFTPKLDETAQELRLRCTGLRQRLVGRPGEQEIGTQPCTFVIPLHNRPTA